MARILEIKAVLHLMCQYFQSKGKDWTTNHRNGFVYGSTNIKNQETSFPFIDYDFKCQAYYYDGPFADNHDEKNR